MNGNYRLSFSTNQFTITDHNQHEQVMTPTANQTHYVPTMQRFNHGDRSNNPANYSHSKVQDETKNEPLI